MPPQLSAALLFLTPMSFLISTTRNCRLLSDWLALAFGLVLGPLLAVWQVGLDPLWAGRGRAHPRRARVRPVTLRAAAARQRKRIRDHSPQRRGQLLGLIGEHVRRFLFALRRFH